ncbi:hypothetical protein H4V97_001551 [Flavobacterium sp. CG_23.5]|uniref:ribosomal maturation YjgA family protein n=1 Tax=Flavobacterium sp. CG_23.5 TaxID=2760708 RepID=UPI001AE22D3E|nr:DUF2809 domain-containing protein [Flavobacterium sp. CG_23.5]MBP2283233.1 hypothetical protein [Flavobacterium sp. CG_23.5]
MKNKRIHYLITILTIILLGIFSRQIPIVPLCVGDILYAIMIYFIIRLLFLKTSKHKAALIAISICFAIEFSQLYQADWITAIRNTVAGHYVLGQGFLLIDLVAYPFGIFIAFILDRFTK